MTKAQNIFHLQKGEKDYQNGGGASLGVEEGLRIVVGIVLDPLKINTLDHDYSGKRHYKDTAIIKNLIYHAMVITKCSNKLPDCQMILLSLHR